MNGSTESSSIYNEDRLACGARGALDKKQDKHTQIAKKRWRFAGSPRVRWVESSDETAPVGIWGGGSLERMKNVWGKQTNRLRTIQNFFAVEEFPVASERKRVCFQRGGGCMRGFCPDDGRGLATDDFT